MPERREPSERGQWCGHDVARPCGNSLLRPGAITGLAACKLEFDPALIAFLLLFAGLYAFSDHRLDRTGGRRSAGNKGAFYAGWMVVALALVSPLCPLSVSLFSARVAQHMLLALVAAPLVVAGRPMQAIAAFRASFRLQQWARPALLSATTVFALLLWFWHAPGPTATFGSTLVYWTMHLTVTGQRAVAVVRFAG